MTRINIIPIEQVSDQHLMAEYRELPRMIPLINIWMNNGSPPIDQHTYILGKGHMKFFLDKGSWLTVRHARVLHELEYIREYNITLKTPLLFPTPVEDGYPMVNFSIEEELINRARIREKILLRPTFYTWTNRQRPDWTY